METKKEVAEINSQEWLLEEGGREKGKSSRLKEVRKLWDKEQTDRSQN